MPGRNPLRNQEQSSGKYVVDESPEAGKHSLERAAASHGNGRSEGRGAEEKVKRSGREHFNHFMTTEGSRAGRRHPLSGARVWPLVWE